MTIGPTDRHRKAADAVFHRLFWILPPPPELPGDELPFVEMITHYIDRAPIFRKAIELVF
jgi:hypothetical protein